jgi:hypothetical protein
LNQVADAEEHWCETFIITLFHINFIYSIC